MYVAHEPKKKCIEKYAIKQTEVNLIVCRFMVAIIFKNNFYLKIY